MSSPTDTLFHALFAIVLVVVVITSMGDGNTIPAQVKQQEPTKTLHTTKYRLENTRMTVYEFHMDDRTRCILVGGHDGLQCDFGGVE